MNTTPNNSQVTDSLVVSEPPDIRNWFSSYKYQSPELDTGENFCDSLRVEDGERGLCVEDSEVEEEGDCEDLSIIRKTKQSSIRKGVARSIIRVSGEGAERHIDVHVPAVEVPAYPDSFSLPSEPEDIRNWFSSYVYESPALDSAELDILLPSNCAVVPINGVEYGGEEHSKELTGRMELCSGNDTNSSDFATNTRLTGVENDQSHSTGQEKECFERSTTYFFNRLIPEKSSDKSTEEAAPNSLNKSVAYPRTEVEDVLSRLHEAQQIDGEKCFGSPSKATSTKVPAYPDSFSLPSEPEDIRNWFSSYVYESPALDSAELDIVLPSNCAVVPIDGFDYGREENLKELTGRMKLCSGKETSSSDFATNTRLTGVENDQSHSTGQEKECFETSTTYLTCLIPEKSPDKSTEIAAPDSLNRSVAYQRTEVEDVSPRLHEAQQIDGEKCSGSPSKATSTNVDIETGGVAPKDKQSTVSKNDSGWILPKYKSREASGDSNTKKEQIQCQYSENKYMLKKRASSRLNDENSPTQLDPSNCNSNRNSNLVSSSYQVKDGGLRREAFKEVTNLNHSLAEVAGKWRCPQKAKPRTGPPLKQLRLERWVRRV